MSLLGYLAWSPVIAFQLWLATTLLNSLIKDMS